MPKYNTPDETDLLGVIANLRTRIDRLERYGKQATIDSVSPIKSAEYNVGVSVTSGTFVDTYIFPCIFQASTPIVRFSATCSDVTTAGEVRLADETGLEMTDMNGVAVPPTDIPAGTTDEVFFENSQSPNYWRDLAIGVDQIVKLQVRRTAGTGTIEIKAKYLIQVPS